jgi:hypothetical protein
MIYAVTGMILVTGGVASVAYETKRHGLAVFAAFWCGYNLCTFIKSVFQ